MRDRTIATAAVLLALLATSAFGQGTPPLTVAPSAAQTMAAASAEPAYQGYILGAHDAITVALLGRSDYNATVQVQEDGSVALPMIGQVLAGGQSLLQLKADIEGRLRTGGYFRQPEVSIVLSAAASRFATILGDVGTAGLVPLDRQYRLSELIARAGGARSGSDTLTVTAPDGQIREYSLRAITTSASPDPVVAPGSKVFVQPAPIFYVYGQVGSAGAFPLEPGMTLRNALARAGGPSALGTMKKVKVYRGETIISKPDMNMRVSAGDTIHVGERIF
jgi:polysaccharide export outer membrane protein